MRALVVASPKGGDGKTTLSLNLAFALARRGWRILLIEVDSQGSLGSSLSAKLQRAPGLVGMTLHNHPLERARIVTRQVGLHLLPVGALPRQNSALWRSVMVQQQGLLQVLEQARAEYDLCILDTPAGLGELSLAAMRAANALLSPIQAEPLALRCFPQLLEQLHWLRSEDYAIELTGMIVTMWQAESAISSASLHEIRQRFPSHVLFRTHIPRDQAFLEASAVGSPLGLMPSNFQPLALLFEQLAIELEDRLSLVEQPVLGERMPLVD
ncbi:MAG: ParA family protein [Myxococcales bacterium]|nr:ParA family protein [Myxococcales bacterium]MCB9644054.1 ParA family protein [Myxococcales bacterium]